KVNLVGLLETKIKSNKFENIVNKMFSGWNNINNLGEHYNGRIWISWRPDYYKIQPKMRTAQVITCEITYVPLKLQFMLSRVYAHNTREERKELWETLVQLSSNCQKPWLILGDFNSVLKMEDRMGGNPVAWSEVVDFQNCVDTCGLIELLQQGQKYTWNDRNGDHRLFSKIDWMFINEIWLNTM
ncbi:hypothetical protein A4A49_66105, partial [Nicotiana attenuata]